MITYQIKRLTTKKKRVLYITSKAPNYYIEELIKSGEYKKLNIKYYSPLWLRFQLVKYLINIKDKRKEFIPESPKANDEISFQNLSLEKNRKGINFKLSTLLLLIWSFLFPFQGNLAGSLYEKYSAGHFIKGKKKLVYAKPNLINKVFPFLFPNNYYFTEKDLTIKTDLSIERILNLEIPEKSDVVLSAFDSLEKQLFVKNIKTSNKLKHKIELNRFDKLSDDGKYKILLLSNNFASSFEFSKVGDKYFYSPNKKQNFLKLNYQLNKNDRRYVYSKNIEKVTLHNKDSLITNRNSDSTYNYETNIKTGLSRRRFLKTAGLVTAAFFVPKSVFTSPKDTLSVYVPDVEGIKYNGSLVEVFDDFGNSLGSGTTIDSLATFLVTGVEDDNAIKSKTNVSFNPVTKELTYSLDGSSRVDIRLSDMLGRQRKIYSGNGHSGENTIKLDLDGLSSGRYVISVETNKYASNIMFTGDGNLITGLKSSGILHKQGTRLKDGALKKAMGDNYKVVVSGPNHYTRTFVVPVQNNIEDRVVGYVQQDNVDEQLFRDFYEEAINMASDNDLTYTGLKTGFRMPGRKMLIGNLGRDGSTVDDTQRQYVKDLIENEIMPYLSEPIPVEFRDYSSVDDINLFIDGELLLLPYDKFNFAVSDPEQDGIINSGIAQLNRGYYDSRRHNEIMEECTSLLFGYNDVNNNAVSAKTVLRGGNTIHPMDIKLIRMLEYYKPLEKKENILG